ncbi:undecaprenyl-diphosphatase [Streptomyces olivoverticillatus]|uniref:Undecaprenyl-diphosphatase n=1 Tax=Streptomyces olivoverticillatus TaxID=66427 RepID=A0A7W7LJY1_9ACTN|nr:phosphatase PAP2 family protein [Streptomyces olivoverticillatus]MBB4891011.1 undecaprenyl-diphosphatase [Streptomyces olivoverticillatus]
MKETPRPQGTAGDAVPVLPQCRTGRALAHTTGALGSGNPHRSDARPPHTPRGARRAGRHGGLGTSPPVPGPSAFRPRTVLFPALCIALFALLAWQIAAHGPLRALDERLGRGAEGAGALPWGVCGFLADLGNTAVALPVLGAALLFSALRPAAPSRRWLPPLAAALAMAAVPALVVPLKAWLARPGPPVMAGGVHEGFFPSGHAATAAVAYGAAALLLLPRRLPAALAYVLLNAGVGVGLVRRGYHWPLDVLGAWCLSGALLWCLALVVSRPGRAPGPRPPRASPPPARPGP